MKSTLAFEFVLLAAIWGSSFLFSRLGAMEFGPLATAFLRVAVASAALLPLVAWRGQLPALRRHLRPILAVGVLNSAIPFVLLAYAVLHISTGLSSILNATTPLWGALVAWLWLRERPNGSRTLGLVVGFVGVALLSWDKASFQPGGGGLAVLACLGATLCYGIAGSFTKKYLTGVPPLATATGSQLSATLVLAGPAALAFPSLAGPQAPGLRAWGAIVLLGLLCTGVAYVIYFRLIGAAGPARALAVTFLIPVFAIGYGVAFLGEALTPWMLGSGAVIVLGTALSTGLLKLGR